jgi:hypothetical protein
VCSAWVDVDSAASRALITADLGSGTPEQLQAIVKEFWSAQEPGLAAMEPAPDPIKADVATLLAVARTGASTGDSATFTSPEVTAADRNIDEYMLRTCGYQHLQVTATDSGYRGLPATVGSGPVGITLDDQGQDTHQILIVRVRDDVTQPFAELLDLPPEQRVQMATPIGSVEAEPGEANTVFFRLSPGRYGAADFLSQGTTSLGAPGGGAPHYLLGLRGEFTAM